MYKREDNNNMNHSYMHTYVHTFIYATTFHFENVKKVIQGKWDDPFHRMTFLEFCLNENIQKKKNIIKALYG